MTKHMKHRSSDKSHRKVKQSLGSRIFDVVNIIFLVLLALTTLYPFWDSLVVSFSSLRSYLASDFHFWPAEWSFEAYEYMFNQSELWSSYLNTLIVTVVGTAINVLVTSMAAYVLSKDWLRGQRVFMFLIVFTMLFTGGMIPTYVVVDSLHLTNTLWAMILRLL